MATMYPKNIELYNATYSEKKVYKALQEQLPDYYIFCINGIDAKRYINCKGSKRSGIKEVIIVGHA